MCSEGRQTIVVSRHSIIWLIFTIVIDGLIDKKHTRVIEI